jgi:chromosome segregation ATPase
MKHIFLIIILIILSSEISVAEVYKWVDEKGVLHFTDDIMQVPEKYRPQIEKIGVSEERAETKTDAEPSLKKKGDTYKDQLGRGEDYWKGRIEEWRKKLKESQERVINLRIKYNELTEKFNDSKSTAERANLRRERDDVKNEMERYKTQIEEAKHMLEKKIPEEAEIFRAKPEWIKQ